MLDLSDIEDRLVELKEAVDIQTRGLHQIIGFLATVESTQRRHTGMLVQIQELLMPPETHEENPLSQALAALAAGIKDQAAVLARIESAVTGTAR
jgi:hypothetical protein